MATVLGSGVVRRLALPALACSLVACSATTPDSSVEPSHRPTIVVTFSVIGSVVSELVAGAATVEVIVPDGQDPHDFQPSARDMEAMSSADLLVINGLGLEELLEPAVTAAVDAGVALFDVSAHVAVRPADGGSDEAHGAGDPHLWLSPATVLEAAPALADALAAAIGAPVDPSRLTDELAALDAELAAQFGALGTCELVTGHDELGYFANRYGCEVVGAVVPSMTTTADASAGQLAELTDVIAEHGATTVFTSLGTPQDVAEQIARETGASVVPLATHSMGDNRTYAEFIRSLADTILGALR